MKSISSQKLLSIKYTSNMLSLSAKGLSRYASPAKLLSPFLVLGARTFIPLKSMFFQKRISIIALL